MKKRQSFKGMIVSVFVLLGVIISLSGCGNDIKGEYMATNGSGVVFNFKSSGIVEFNGMSFPFEQNKRIITIKENGKEETIIVNDDGSLQINSPFGGAITLKKKK